MEFTVQQIAEIIGGRIEGDANTKVNKLSKIEEGSLGSLSFLANKLYTPFIYNTNASAVIVNEDFVAEQPVKTTLIRVIDAYSAFAQLLEFYNHFKLNKIGISDKSHISNNVKLGENLYIGEFSFIGENAVIGNNVKIYPQVYIGENVIVEDNTTLFAGVKIYSDCIIRSNCIIHSGVVLGADGFGFAPQADNNYKKVAQIGNVVIGNNVEIGANTTVDRATLGSTIIKDGVKLDNQVQIAHNVVIGENTVIVAQTGIAGSSKIGKNCVIAGQVGIVGHIQIADNVTIAAQSGVTGNIKKEGSILLGSPAFDANECKKSYIYFRNFSKIVDRLNEIEKKLNQK